VSNGVFSSPPQHVERRSEKVTHLSYFFVSQDLSLLFSYFLNAGGERERERKETKKFSMENSIQQNYTALTSAARLSPTHSLWLPAQYLHSPSTVSALIRAPV